MSYLLLRSDARSIPLADRSVHCVVCSPPYYGLRDYQCAGQLGLEASPEEYLARMVAVFREVKRVLRDDGTIFVNMGDSYAGGGGYSPDAPSNRNGSKQSTSRGSKPGGCPGLASKQLLGIPWRVAFALQADGWYLRSDIIWAKPNPMPESVTDRPTKAHEYVFMMAKSERYFYDAQAIAENATYSGKVVTLGLKSLSRGQANGRGIAPSGNGTAASITVAPGRNRRSVWSIPSHPLKMAHFATMPLKLAATCIRAGTSKRGVCSKCGAPWERVVKKTGETNARTRTDVGDFFPEKGGHPSGIRSLSGATYKPQRRATGQWRPTCSCDAPVRPAVVFDPFAGAGSTLVAATALGRSAVGLDLKPEYLAMARRRIERPHARMRTPRPDESPGPLFAFMAERSP